jgi:hypothetical protein
MPSNRYAQIAPQIREICERYQLSYTTGTLPQQVYSAWKQVVKLSVPNGMTPRSAIGGVVRGAAPALRPGRAATA